MSRPWAATILAWAATFVVATHLTARTRNSLIAIPEVVGINGVGLARVAPPGARQVTVTVDGRPEPVPAGRPARRVLASIGGPCGGGPRSEVAALLWPDVLDTSARTSLRSALVKVTRCVGAEHVLATRDAVGLDADGVDVDLGRFRLAAAGEKAGRGVAAGPRSAAAGIDEDWVHDERASLSAQVAAVLDSLADGSEEQGDLPAAVAWTRETVEREPLSSSTCRR